MPQQLPKAILFDLDHTILSYEGREVLLRDVVGEFADHLSPIDLAEIASAIEAAFLEFWAVPGSYDTWRNRLLEARVMIVTELFQTRWGLSSELAAQVATRFHHRRETGGDRLFPGAIATLEGLRRRGVRLALVTNGHADSQRAKIDVFDLARHFDHVQIEGEHGFGKPEERAYRHAMQTLGTEPHETWMVGDHLEWEVAAPQRLGIYGVWVDHKREGLPPDGSVIPDRIVHSIGELLPSVSEETAVTNY